LGRSTALLLSGAYLLIAAPAVAEPVLQGRAFLVLSDADGSASSYITGELGSRAPGDTDTLTVIPLKDGRPGPPATVQVSNGVRAWPNTLAVSPDGRLAAVAEVNGPRRGDTLRDLPLGTALTLVDLSDFARPRVAQRLNFANPAAVAAFHPEGDLIGVGLQNGGGLALVSVAAGRMGQPRVQPLTHPDLVGGSVQELRWSPNGRFAAITSPQKERVAFFRLVRDGAGPKLEPWGDPLRTAGLPGVGRWTPDGRHFVVTNINVTPDMAQSAYARSASTFTVYRFDPTDRPDSMPARGDEGRAPAPVGVRHLRVAHVAATRGGYVENFVISPDGRWLVALNMEASWLPAGTPGRTHFSSLTLVRLDPGTADLEPVHTVRFAGVLPEGIAFDASGRSLAVTLFGHGQAEGTGPGAVEFWTLDPMRGRLLKEDQSIRVTRGAHVVELAL